jgi:hypothetical protein
MKILSKLLVLTCSAVLLVSNSGGVRSVIAADEKPTSESSKVLQEMPVLTGDQWVALTPEAKIAFIWGVGHVVTIEENVIRRHPELQRKGFTAKLAEGLQGMTMDSIIQALDAFYAKNPDELDLPIMGALWSQVVRPKLKSGILDLSLIHISEPTRPY